MHCNSNANTAVIFSAIKGNNFWESDDLDCILNEEDIVFKFVGLQKLLAGVELPLDINLEAVNILVELLARESILFMEKKNLFKNVR